MTPARRRTRATVSSIRLKVNHEAEKSFKRSEVLNRVKNGKAPLRNRLGRAVMTNGESNRLVLGLSSEFDQFIRTGKLNPAFRTALAKRNFREQIVLNHAKTKKTPMEISRTIESLKKRITTLKTPSSANPALDRIVLEQTIATLERLLESRKRSFIAKV